MMSAKYGDLIFLDGRAITVAFMRALGRLYSGSIVFVGLLVVICGGCKNSIFLGVYYLNYILGDKN
jgi:hypothetical protein